MKLQKSSYAKSFQIFSIAIGWAALTTTAQAQDLVTNFTAGQPNGVYSFSSWTPKSLPDLLKGNTLAESVNVTGHLFLPPGSEKVPAVLLMHGSGGIYSAMLGYWPEQFNAAGFAVLSVDSFGPRGVT